jgi:hypothetical protein
MTTDDILKLIMAGTGSAAALYTISHPQTTAGRTVTLTGNETGTTITSGVSPLILIGGIVLIAVLVLKH